MTPWLEVTWMLTWIEIHGSEVVGQNWCCLTLWLESEESWQSWSVTLFQLLLAGCLNLVFQESALSIYHVIQVCSRMHSEWFLTCLERLRPQFWLPGWCWSRHCEMCEWSTISISYLLEWSKETIQYYLLQGVYSSQRSTYYQQFRHHCLTVENSRWTWHFDSSKKAWYLGSDCQWFSLCSRYLLVLTLPLVLKLKIYAFSHLIQAWTQIVNWDFCSSAPWNLHPKCSHPQPRALCPSSSSEPCSFRSRLFQDRPAFLPQ